MALGRFGGGERLSPGGGNSAQNPEKDDFGPIETQIATKLVEILRDPSEAWWFVMKQFNQLQSSDEGVRNLLRFFPIQPYEIEYKWGTIEPFIINVESVAFDYINAQVKPTLSNKLNEGLADLIIAKAFSMYCAHNVVVLHQVRLNFATHFRDGLTPSEHPSLVRKWDAVVQALGGRGLALKASTDGTKISQDRLSSLNVTPLLIMQSAKIIFTSEYLREKPKNSYIGSCIEVMITNPKYAPFLIYYKNVNYYAAMSGFTSNSANFGNAEEYRSKVSIELIRFLVDHIKDMYGIDISHPQMHFSHNKIHTNVIAYVASMEQWYPIQHSSSETDSATEKKVALVNSGEAQINDFIALARLSP